jgi:hypothetical protein
MSKTTPTLMDAIAATRPPWRIRGGLANKAARSASTATTAKKKKPFICQLM